jgi:hypothetical protein
MGVRQGLALPRDRRGWFVVEIQFTRVTKTYFVSTIEPDAVTALLDRHMIGDISESVSDRLWAASAYSAVNEAFWSELSDQAGTEVADTETDFDLDEEDSDEEGEDDYDDDQEDDEDNADTAEYDGPTMDLGSRLIDA